MRKPLLKALFIVAFGLVLACMGFAMLGCSSEIYDDNDYEDCKFECKKGIETIKMNCLDLDYEINKGNVDKIKIDYRDKKDDKQIEIKETDDNVLEINKKDEDTVHIVVGISRKSRTMKITVPENFSGKVKVDGESSDGKISKVKLSELDIHHTSGDLDLNDVEVDKDAKLECNSGDIKLDQVKADNVKIEEHSGDTSLRNVISSNNVEVVSHSGNIKLNTLEADKIDLEASSGDIEGSIKGKQEDFNITTKASSGDCNLSDRKGGNKTLNVKVSSGDIDIDFKE